MPKLPVERAYYSPVVERMSREELLGLQWRRLKVLLAYAYTIPFYHQRFRRARLTPDDMQSWEDFRRLPLITKADIIADQEEYPPYGSILGVPEEKLVRFHLTAGTSGKGQQVLGLTRVDLETEAVWARGFYWTGVRRGDLVANLSATSVGPMAGSDSKAKAYDRMGVNHLHLGVTYTTEQKLQMMKRFSPHFVFGVSRRVRQACQELGLEPRRDFSRLKAFMGERGNTVDEILAAEDYWDARMGDFYGSTETRTGIANTCEKGMLNNGKLGQYHIWEDYCLFEFLDPERREPVSFGEPGEIVITNLHAEASPLIRFASNDKAVVLSPAACDCGRPFLGIQIGSVERYDDMMKVRGMNVWPAAVDAIVLTKEEVAEYQGRAFFSPDGHEEIVVAVEFKPGVSEERRSQLLARLTKELRDKIGLRIPVEEARQPFPKYEEGGPKPRRWMDTRRSPQAEGRR